jgi:hypothetical protein
VRPPLVVPALGYAMLACAVVLLSGCVGSGTPTTPPRPAIASHAPSPAATSTPMPITDALFTISAKVRSATGATIGIQLTARPPLAASDEKATGLLGEFLDQCGKGVGGTPVTRESLVATGSTLVRLDLTSTTDGQTFVSPLDLFLGSNFSAKAASGKGIVGPPSANGCVGTYSWASSGTAHGIAEFENDSAQPDFGKWRYGLYGFSVQPGTNATIESCAIALTALAKAANVSAVAGWASTDTSGTTCVTGYSGE